MTNGIDVEHVDGIDVVTLRGEHDLSTASDVSRRIDSALETASGLAIDLSETTFIDSMTLGVLLGALKRLTQLDGRLAIACPSRNLRRIFEITSLDEVLRIADTTADAVSLVQAGDTP
jgi:anti-sigma B factor antagonist